LTTAVNGGETRAWRKEGKRTTVAHGRVRPGGYGGAVRAPTLTAEEHLPQTPDAEEPDKSKKGKKI
jgi:hypothetical protein